MLFYKSSETNILDSYRRILKSNRIGQMIKELNANGMIYLSSRIGDSHLAISLNPTVFTHEILIGRTEYTISKCYFPIATDISVTTQYVNPYRHRCHSANGRIYERVVGKFLVISKQPLPLGKLRILIFKGVKI